MRVILLTRPSTLQGTAIVEAFARAGLPLAAALIEPKSLGERRKRLRAVYRQNGLISTFRKVGRIMLEDHLPGLLRRSSREEPETVDAVCRRYGVRFHMVSDHNAPECERILRTADPDVVLLAGTRIIKAHILKVPHIGTINAHTGWLPNYRGRNANLWAFLEGGPTGITTHFVDPGVDTGDILIREPFPIGPGDTIQSLELRAARHCAELMLRTVRGLEAGTITPTPQRKEDGRQFPALPVGHEDEVRRRLAVPIKAGANVTTTR